MASALSEAEPTRIATQWGYELVPLLALPEVDLAVSVKSRFIRSKALHRIFRTLARSPLTLLAFYAFEVSAVVVFFLPAPVGRVLGVVGTLAGIPGIVINIGNFRYELVVVLLKTFDTWFSVLVVSVMSILTSVLLHDTRGLLAVMAWLTYMPNVFVDASTLGMRTIWLGNVCGAISHTIIGVAVGMQVTDQVFLYNIIEANGRALPATAVARDSLTSMVVVMTRNLFRKFHSVLRADQPALGARVTCVSFRCRLQLQPCLLLPAVRTIHTGPMTATKSKLEYAPTINGLLDIRHTLVQTPWLFRVENAPSTWHKYSIKCLALASVVIVIAVGFVEMLTPLDTVHIDNTPLTALAAIATTITILFVGTCVALMQRQLLREIVTSFDFLFFAAQITVVDLALADLLYWKPTIVLALVSEWLWMMWVLSWDAITPYTRRRLGVTPKFAAIIVTTLIVTITLTAVIVFTVLPPLALHDRVIFRLNVLAHSMDFRVLPWYCSGVATIVAGTSRLVWRLWQATENELVLLDGPVVYESTRVRRVGHPSVLARARVAPLTQSNVRLSPTPSALACVLRQ